MFYPCKECIYNCFTEKLFRKRDLDLGAGRVGDHVGVSDVPTLEIWQVMYVGVSDVPTP